MKKRKICFLFALAALLSAPAAADAQTQWTKSKDNPVLRVGEKGAWDSERVEAGSVLFDGTTYTMWYSGNDNSTWRIGIATSPDGIAWTKSPNNPVFEPGPSGSWEDEHVYSPNVVLDGATYHLYYGASHEGITQIGHATSDNGTAWTRDSANPVIALGTAGAWDSGNIDLPSVLITAGSYKMWYTAGASLYVPGAVGYAESADGSAWTKYESNPVLTAGPKGFFDAADLFSSAVVFDNSTYHLWYATYKPTFSRLHMGIGKLGYASSTDGKSWTKHDKPVLKPGRGFFFGWDGMDIYYPYVMLQGGQFKMWYTGRGRFGKARHSQVGYATSPQAAQ